MAHVEVLLTSGTKIYLEKDSIEWHEDLGLVGYNKNENKQYTIPIRAILFLRSDKSTDESK